MPFPIKTGGHLDSRYISIYIKCTYLKVALQKKDCSFSSGLFRRQISVIKFLFFRPATAPKTPWQSSLPVKAVSPARPFQPYSSWFPVRTVPIETWMTLLLGWERYDQQKPAVIPCFHLYYMICLSLNRRHLICRSGIYHYVSDEYKHRKKYIWKKHGYFSTLKQVHFATIPI